MTIKENVAHMVTTITPFLTTIGAGATLAGSGFAGPLRAFVLAIRSKVRPAADPFTNRNEELQKLHKLLKVVYRQQYIVVFGQEGVGKSCLVNSATSRMCGIIKIKISPTKEADEIVDLALRRVANIRTNLWDPDSNARRVIWWYKLMFFKQSPLIVLKAVERIAGDPFANISAAVRILTEKYGLRVIVDGSLNSLHPELFLTGRCKKIEIFPMTKNLIRNLPQLKSVFQAVENAKLDEVVWEVLGGLPSKYEDLRSTLEEKEGKDERNVIGDFLLNEIGDAIELVIDTKIAHPQMKQILAMFDDTRPLPSEALVPQKLQRPVPDKVLREVKRDGKWVLVPSTNAIGIVLHQNLTKTPSLVELQKIVENLE